MGWLGIVNPHAGWGKKGVPLTKTLSSLKKITPHYIITDYSGHAEQLARDASDCDGFAVAGGDGTIFEVLNGMDCERQGLAIIPAGTGNSLARDFELTGAKREIDAIHEENMIAVDLIRVTFKDKDGVDRTRISASTIALGYPAMVGDRANRHYKFLGKLCYPVAATAGTLFQKRFSARLSYCSLPPESKLLSGLIINNTRHVANFLAFPNASINDGSFDVMEMRAGFFRQNLHNLSVLSKKHFYSPAILKREDSLIVNMERPQDLVIDGEIYSDIIGIQVQTLPRLLRYYQMWKV
ncbi:MAG: diacylglycerol/lipid kinase family protein [Nitrospiria bacterium]